MDRPSVIVGTTNEDQFLADSTGNRRYWVVPMNRKLDNARLLAERDRIWAAAVALYKQGEQWWLTEEEGIAADADRQKYEETDPWTYSIEDYIYNLERVSTREILCNALDLPIPKHNQSAYKKVLKIMKALRWDKTPNPVSYKNRKTRVWEKNLRDIEIYLFHLFQTGTGGTGGTGVSEKYK